MLKFSFIAVVLSGVLSAFFIPTFSFGGGDSNNIDANFERDDRTQIVLDKRALKIYYDAPQSKQMNFDTANTFCQDNDFLGYKGWRVASKEEAVSLLELSRNHIRVKHAFKNIQKARYWTATEDKFYEAWYIDFDLGRYSTNKRDNEYYPLCVLNL